MKKITCVIDNSVKSSSPLWGEHGLAFRIDTDDGSVQFDTGASAALLAHNLARLDTIQRPIDAIVFSHAHFDHTGGLKAILPEAGSKLPLYANPDIFRPRYSRRSTGDYKFIGLAVTEAELAQYVDLRLKPNPVQIVPGLWTTGEITERPEPEGRSARHFVPAEAGWQADPYADDLSLVLETGTGLVVICGCCHAGLLNTLSHVRRIFERPITTVIGGTHLVAADADYLQHVIDVLRNEYGTLTYYLNHCTGEPAFLALASAFGNRVHSCPAGTALTFT